MQPQQDDQHQQPLSNQQPQGGNIENIPAQQSQTVPNEQPPAVQPTAEPQSPQPQTVYMTRPLDPGPAHISEEAQKRHEASQQKYPSLNLSTGEYVISAVRRHPIGLIPIFVVVGVILVGLGAMIPFYDSFRSSGGSNLPPTSIVSIIILLIGLLVCIGGYVAVYIYVNNKFYLTNESVVQEIQDGLFSKHEQTVSLINIEDASYQQRGLLPFLLNYGSIRLSTEGDETTYRFNYVANPKKEISQLNNAVEAFKNGRPVVND